MIKSMANECGKDKSIFNKYSFSKQFKDLIYYSGKEKYKLLTFLFIGILLSLIGMLPPYLYGLIIDDLTKGIFSKIYVYLGITAMSYIIYQIIRNIMTYKLKIFSLKVKNNTKLFSYKHLFNLDYHFFKHNSSGMYLERIEKGANSIQKFIVDLFRSVIVKIFGIIFSLIVVIKINLSIGIFSLFVCYLFWYYQHNTLKKLVDYENNVHVSGEKVYSKIIDFFSNIGLIKFLNVKDKLLSLLNNSYEEILENQKKARSYERIKVAISTLIMELSSVITLTYLAHNVIHGSITIGVAVMVYGFFLKITDNSTNIYEVYHQLVEYRTSMYRLSLIYENKPTIVDPKVSKIPKKYDVSFNNVNFIYDDSEKKTLNDVSLNIKSGEKLAIVGLSGSGKSTLMSLLLRCYVPNSGSVKIGDINVNDISFKNLYNIVKIVPQNNELINTSIKENFELTVDRKITEQEIIAALKNSASYEFVNKLPEKINTVVGAQGQAFSGGEKQRLCIARALLSNPEIIVLDEATASLDVITEKKVYDSISKLSKTIISITHRINSLHYFDRIIVMNDGKIVGEGTHNHLMKTNIYYRKLKEAQKKNKN
jgi:ABC-type bacteriocin/lantibiotic exporter with double-glycine peptidase domain